MVITKDNYDALVPKGREVDAIIGDYILRNDLIVAVIGRPVEGRNANFSAREVGGCVIDLSLREHPNDLLTVFTPGGGRSTWRNPEVAADGEPRVWSEDTGSVRGRKVSLTLHAAARKKTPAMTLTYTLDAGASFIEVTTRSAGAAVDTFDEIRADGPSFTWSPDGEADLIWTFDPWFGQAYGVSGQDRSGSSVTKEGRSKIAWGRSADAVTRRLHPGADLFSVMATHRRMRGEVLHPVRLEVTDSEGGPVAAADVLALPGSPLPGEARTGVDGTLDMNLPAGAWALSVSALGRGETKVEVSVGAGGASGTARAALVVKATLGSAAAVIGSVTNEAGEPIPSKVMFVGTRKTPTPDFGPTVNDENVRNLVYTPNGRFTRVLPPGDYKVTASHGPEHDAVTKTIHVPRGPARVPFEAVLRRSVATPGWISADFHGHSTSSGDNAAGRRGRVLNYAAEGIEFAPCTEHNRVDTYVPLIEEMRLTEHLATSDGIELTGRPLPLNHHNAFPLVMRPRIQGNGAPRPDRDPLVQIRRLSEWDQGSEKLVQQNHPDIGGLFFDRDGDGYHDHGHQEMAQYQDVMEIWTEPIDLTSPKVVTFEAENGRKVLSNNRLFNWLQLLNQGFRIPGVANTDAHHNFHGSGGVRNYVRSGTDAPARIDALEIVREAERGRIIVTNGPYMEVSLEPVPAVPGGRPSVPGDEIAAPGGRVALHVRVQCPNWFDVDRVAVLINGRPDSALTFTRQDHAERFGSGPVKFDQRLAVELAADAHLIVVASHGDRLLSPIMGPRWGKQPPFALSNPIYVDVDGGGFAPSKDTLGHPLPVKGE